VTVFPHLMAIEPLEAFCMRIWEFSLWAEIAPCGGDDEAVLTTRNGCPFLLLSFFCYKPTLYIYIIFHARVTLTGVSSLILLFNLMNLYSSVLNPFSTP
jgi:hypothetical protein